MVTSDAKRFSNWRPETKREEKRPFRTYKIGKVGQASMCDNPPLGARTSESLKVQNIRHGTTYHMVSELCVPALWYVLLSLCLSVLSPTYLIFPLHITAELRDVTTFIFKQIWILILVSESSVFDRSFSRCLLKPGTQKVLSHRRVSSGLRSALAKT